MSQITSFTKRIIYLRILVLAKHNLNKFYQNQSVNNLWHKPSSFWSGKYWYYKKRWDVKVNCIKIKYITAAIVVGRKKSLQP